MVYAAIYCFMLLYNILVHLLRVSGVCRVLERWDRMGGIVQRNAHRVGRMCGGGGMCMSISRRV